MHLIAIGEIFLKGKNRILFERRLLKNIRSALNLKENDLIKFRNRYLIKDDINVAKLKQIFGIIFYVKVNECKADNINETALSLIKNEKTFRVSAKKSLSLNKSSTTLNEEVGSYILDKKPSLKVNLDNPEIDIRLEELRNNFYVYRNSDLEKGLGGLPLGTSGFVHLIVNDEIKSTVSAFLIMKRGCVVSVSKDLPLIHKVSHGFNLRIREEKEFDIIATDEVFENLNIKEENKMILRPLIGYSEKEIKELYEKIKNL